MLYVSITLTLLYNMYACVLCMFYIYIHPVVSPYPLLRPSERHRAVTVPCLLLRHMLPPYPRTQNVDVIQKTTALSRLGGPHTVHAHSAGSEGAAPVAQIQQRSAHSHPSEAAELFPKCTRDRASRGQRDCTCQGLLELLRLLGLSQG